MREETNQASIKLQGQIDNIKPQVNNEVKFTGLKGWSQLTAKLTRVQITNVAAPEIGQIRPSFVEALVKIDLTDLPRQFHVNFTKVDMFETFYLVKFGP